MIKKLSRCVREYKFPAIITMLFIIAEVVIEAIIPFKTAELVNLINSGLDMGSILSTGAVL
ncbi:MAG: ABC transporter ATP-binding protein, partial [Oscillospiraceae bacterium]|nr:ABC transporter ATP-binding protein [Oscillospiraceae bacterium]